MKILFATNGYPPQRWAGTETYTAGIVEELTARGHFVQVLCIGSWQSGNKYWNGISKDTHDGIPVTRINLNWAKAPDPFRYLYDNPVTARYLEGFLQRNTFDLVHVTSCETLSASIFQVVKNAALPLYFSLTDFWMLCPRINLLHSKGFNCNGKTTADECLSCMGTNSGLYNKASKILPEKSLLPVMSKVSQYKLLTRSRGLRGAIGNMAERKSMLRHALSLPDYRVTASSFVRDVFVSNVEDLDIAVEPYGHDLSWLNSYMGKSKSDVLRLAFIGQIIKAKGVDLLIQALAQLPKAHLDRLSLTIFGNLDHTPSYGEQIREMSSNFSNIYFGGIYPHAESARVFSNIDVLLVPSLWFDFPLIIYEAFATQTPVIATNLGGMAEAVIDGVNGLLFERANTSDLARQIRRLLDEPELLVNLQRGIPRVRTVKEEVNVMEKKYFELI